MKKSKFTGEQIAFALRQAEVGTPVAEVCRKMVYLRRRIIAGSSCTVAWGRRSCAKCASSRRRTKS